MDGLQGILVAGRLLITAENMYNYHQKAINLANLSYEE